MLRWLNLKASLSSLFMVSMSGSSTRKVAQSWQNSPNSISPEPSSSISWSRSYKVQSWKITFSFSFSHLQLLLGGTEAHGPHDLAEVVGGKEVLLLCVEEIKTHLMAKMRVKRGSNHFSKVLPSDTWSHHGQGWSRRWSPQSRYQRKDRAWPSSVVVVVFVLLLLLSVWIRSKD